MSVHLCIVMEGKPHDARFERPSEWDGEAQGGLPRAIKLALGAPAPDGSRPVPSLTVSLSGARK